MSPRVPFSFKGLGLGAWEVAGRLSYTDLNDGNIHGGRLTAFTGGVTWHPHSHLGWKFNYVLGKVKGNDSAGHLHIFETRVEFDF